VLGTRLAHLGVVLQRRLCLFLVIGPQPAAQQQRPGQDQARTQKVVAHRSFPFLIGSMDTPTPERIEPNSPGEKKVSSVKSARRHAARPSTRALAAPVNVAQTRRVGET